MKYKQIYQYVDGTLFGKYLVLNLKPDVGIRSNILCHLKEWVHQKNLKQKPAYVIKEKRKTESDDLGKNYKRLTDVLQRWCKNC